MEDFTLVTQSGAHVEETLYVKMALLAIQKLLQNVHLP